MTTKKANPVQKILAEREKTHGNFRDTARVSQELKQKISKSPNLFSSSQREALEMICHKIARIINGNPSTKDHWDDIAGYATPSSEDIRDDD